jgi:L-threonylcarbamoyladenylate synthase
LPSGTTWQTVLEDLDGRIDAVLRGSTCSIGIESTVVDCISDPPRVLRLGAISLTDLQSVAPETVAYVAGDSCGSPANSPGLRHPHYQPTALVRLVESAIEADQQMKSQAIGALKLEHHLANCAYCGLDESKLGGYLGASRQFINVEQYAQEFYEFMRSIDRLGIQFLYCQRPTASGIGAALNDRLTRAASPKIDRDPFRRHISDQERSAIEPTQPLDRE